MLNLQLKTRALVAICGIAMAVAACGGSQSFAALHLDVNNATLTPSPFTQNFSLTLTLDNTSATPVNIVSWQFRLVFTPAIPSGQVSLLGTGNNIAPGQPINTNPPAPSFVTVSVFSNSLFVTSPVTLPGNSSATLVQLNMQLAANPLQNLYNIAIDNQEISFADSTAEMPTVGSGAISTPEPGFAAPLLASAAALLRRARPAARSGSR